MHKNENNICYEPGDHIAIIPANRLEFVNQIISKIGDIKNSNDNYRLEDLIEEKWTINERFDIPISIKDALTYFLDITTPVTQTFLSHLSTLASNKNESLRLENLSQVLKFCQFKFELLFVLYRVLISMKNGRVKNIQAYVTF